MKTHNSPVAAQSQVVTVDGIEYRYGEVTRQQLARWLWAKKIDDQTAYAIRGIATKAGGPAPVKADKMTPDQFVTLTRIMEDDPVTKSVVLCTHDEDENGNRVLVETGVTLELRPMLFSSGGCGYNVTGRGTLNVGGSVVKINSASGNLFADVDKTPESEKLGKMLAAMKAEEREAKKASRQK